MGRLSLLVAAPILLSAVLISTASGSEENSLNVVVGAEKGVANNLEEYISLLRDTRSAEKKRGKGQQNKSKKKQKFLNKKQEK